MNVDRIRYALTGRSRRLPGTLCDETPGSPVKPTPSGWQPRDDEDETPVIETPAIPTYLDGPLLQRHQRLTDNYLAVCERLREITADRDRLDDANGRLLERIRGLELTVTALTTPGVRVMPLHVEDDELLIRPLAGRDGD